MTDNVLDLIDSVIRDYDFGSDAMRWSPDEPAPVRPSRPRAPGERLDYLDLTADEREAVHEWIRLHHLEPADIPLDGLLGRDEETGEWRIRRYRRREGKLYLDGDGPASCIIRRREQAPLPWRCA